MNKTININLGGFFFHIDETAYQKLKRYLEAISKSLSDDPQGKNEIIADIEARISELLSEKITDARQVVNEGDIDEIIKIMGQPEDYNDAEEAYSQSSYSYERNYSTGKKLFRDPDDKFLGGVASGLSHYIGIDVIWVRLALLALFFGAGFGFLIYVILWILLPEARTTAEKLQMEGTPINIDNIERKIRDEFKNVSDNVKDVANQASEKIKAGANEISEKVNENFSGKARKNNGAEDFFSTIGKIILVFFKIIGKFIGFILVVVAAAVILSLIISGFSVGSLEFLEIDGEFLHYPPFFYDSVLPKWLLTLAVFLLVGIPFLLLFILGLRILSSSVRKLNKATSLTLLGIWLAALLTLVFTGLEFGTSHAKEGSTVQKEALAIQPQDTLTIKMVNNDDLIYRHNLRRSSRVEEITIEGNNFIYSNYIKVDVKKSNEEGAYLLIERESRGRNTSMAKANAEKIKYNFNLSDKTLILDAYFLSEFKNIWKEEQVKATVFLPENVNVFIDNSAKNFLYYTENKQEIYYKDMGNHHFIMTDTVLDCTDCVEEKEEKKEKPVKKEKKTEIEETI
ncbi:MAG: transcriptional regulator [Flavobacteriaceae bacterium]|nr:transcriptional regulator [Flavobacteriaceae bacterium]|tara:strand:+ start:18371 stop:20077 length:1707 start_codon:yes stop_codon:yes gene_type:complete